MHSSSSGAYISHNVGDLAPQCCIFTRETSGSTHLSAVHLNAEHIICLITHIAAAPLFTLCLKRPTAAPASLQKSPVCSDWSDHSVVIGQLLTAVLEM